MNDQARDEMCRRLARYLADEFGHDRDAIRQWLLLAEARAAADAKASERILETHLDAHAAAKAASEAVDALAGAIGRLPSAGVREAHQRACNAVVERTLVGPSDFGRGM